MSYLQPFLKSYLRFFPKIEILSSAIQRRHNLIVNYPLTLQQTHSNRPTLITETPIKKNNDLLLLSMGECIFSSGFTGASQSEQTQINDIMLKLSSQYDVMTPQWKQKMKIYIQLLANVQKIQAGAMPIRDYAEYIMNMPFNGLQKSQINSRYLLALYQNWQTSNKITYEHMSKDLLKRVSEEDFMKACNNGRTVIRNAGNSSFLFAAPFVDKIDHSFTPSCEFQMLYMPHRRSPFIRIRTTRDIMAGQSPTLNYGKLNNYELLIRYGFSVKNNPFSVFMLPLNFENIIQIFNKNIEWKQKQLLSRQMKLKNYVKIQPNGELNSQDLIMMRILINDSQDPQEGILQSDIYDKHINKYISEHAQNIRRSIKINNLKVSEEESIKTLEDEQISILDKYLSTHCTN